MSNFPTRVELNWPKTKSHAWINFLSAGLDFAPLYVFHILLHSNFNFKVENSFDKIWFHQNVNRMRRLMMLDLVIAPTTRRNTYSRMKTGQQALSHMYQYKIDLSETSYELCVRHRIKVRHIFQFNLACLESEIDFPDRFNKVLFFAKSFRMNQYYLRHVCIQIFRKL